jgi:gas vesicle protein
MVKGEIQEEICGRGGACALLSFFVGGAIGAGIALLIASKHGEAMRGKIRELGEEAKQKAEGYIEKVKAGATSAVEHGKDILEQEKSIINKAVEAGKEILEQQKSVISNVAEVGKKKGKN